MQRQYCILMILAGILVPAVRADEIPEEDLERERRILGSLLGGGGGGGLLSSLLGPSGLVGGVLGGVLGGGGGGGRGGQTGMSGSQVGMPGNYNGMPGTSAGTGGGGGGLLGGVLGSGGLLGGLLGGGGGGGGGSGGGASGGLLGGLLGGGSGGLLGNVLGGSGGGLLGGLLGGGGNGGLLGGLLGGGGGGLLGNLLGGNNSLVGNVLGGGLLGGVLGDKGLLGGLLGTGNLEKILTTLFCLLEQLGLGLVLQLLNGLGVNTLLGLNEIACKEGGQDILSFIVSQYGVLSREIIDQLLCLVKTLGARPVLQLLQNLGLERLLATYNVTCPDGGPLFPEGSSASALFKLLIDLLGPEKVTAVGVEGIIKLDQLLAQERVQDVSSFIKQVSCLITNLGLGTVITTLEAAKVNGVVRLNDAVCRNQTSLADIQELIRAGVKIDQILPGLLKAFGLDTVLQLINVIGLPDLLQLGSFLVVNGTVQPNVVRQVFCIASSIGLKLVIRLFKRVGQAELLALYGIVCPNGQAVSLPPNTNVDFLEGLIPSCKPSNQITQCLQFLGQAILQYDLGLVCSFCQLVGIKPIADECVNFCNVALVTQEKVNILWDPPDESSVLALGYHKPFVAVGKVKWIDPSACPTATYKFKIPS